VEYKPHLPLLFLYETLVRASFLLMDFQVFGLAEVLEDLMGKNDLHGRQ
jgi:hypothetical protein